MTDKKRKKKNKPGAKDIPEPGKIPRGKLKGASRKKKDKSEKNLWVEFSRSLFDPQNENWLPFDEKKILEDIEKIKQSDEERLIIEDQTRNLEKGKKSISDDYLFLEPKHEIHNAGNDFYKKGDFINAIKCYFTALRIDPNMLETRFNLSLAFTRKGAYPYALEQINRYIEVNPKHEEAFYTKGLILEYMYDYPQSAMCYLESYRLNPSYLKAKSQLEILIQKCLQNSSNSNQPKTFGRTYSSDEALSDFEFLKEKSDLTLDDYADDTPAKYKLQDYTQMIKSRKIFYKYNQMIPRGLLLFGPPGSGKSYFARIFANECGATFYNVNLAQILNMWLGNSEKNMAKLLDIAAKNDFSVIFFDEFDSIAAKRIDSPEICRAERNILNVLLQAMDGFEKEKYKNIFFLAATNKLDLIDTALINRPGRFAEIIEIGFPEPDARASMFRIHVERIARNTDEPLFVDPIDYTELAAHSDGFVGDEIRHVVEHTLTQKILSHINLHIDIEITTGDLIETIHDYRENRPVLDDLT